MVAAVGHREHRAKEDSIACFTDAKERRRLALGVGECEQEGCIELLEPSASHGLS